MNSNPRILVIDDDPLFRSFLLAMLRSEHIVAVASAGEEGYAKAQSFPPQLVILDMIMPGWSGLQTLKAFRSHESLRDVPVIMLTIDASRATVSASVTAGAVNYLLKNTFSKQDLLRHVSVALRNSESPAGTPNSIGGMRHRRAMAERIKHEWDE